MGACVTKLANVYEEEYSPDVTVRDDGTRTSATTESDERFPSRESLDSTSEGGWRTLESSDEERAEKGYAAPMWHKDYWKRIHEIQSKATPDPDPVQDEEDTDRFVSETNRIIQEAQSAPQHPRHNSEDAWALRERFNSIFNEKEIRRWNRMNRGDPARWKRWGFETAPRFDEFCKKYHGGKVRLPKEWKGYEKRNDFLVYWALCQHDNLPGWTKWNFKHKEDPNGHLGAFDPDGVRTTIAQCALLETSKQLSLFLGTNDPKTYGAAIGSRYPETYKKYKSVSKEHNMHSNGDHMRVKLWPDYYEPGGGDKYGRLRALKKVQNGEYIKVPEAERFVVRENDFPKRLTSQVKSFCVWDCNGEFGGPEIDEKEKKKYRKGYQRTRKRITELIENGTLEVPGIKNPVVLGSYVNSFWNRSIPDLDHYHFFIECEPDDAGTGIPETLCELRPTIEGGVELRPYETVKLTPLEKACRYIDKVGWKGIARHIVHECYRSSNIVSSIARRRLLESPQRREA